MPPDVGPAVTPPPRKPLQFSLRSLMLAVTCLCIVLGLSRVLPSAWFWGAAWFGLLVAGHVIGNSLGTRLRDQSTRENKRQVFDPIASPPAAPRSVPNEPQSYLHQRTPVLGRYFVFSGIGAVLGMMAGASALSHCAGYEVTVGGMLVGSAATGVLGAFAGFLLSSSLSMLIASVLQAQRRHER